MLTPRNSNDLCTEERDTKGHKIVTALGIKTFFVVFIMTTVTVIANPYLTKPINSNVMLLPLHILNNFTTAQHNYSSLHIASRNISQLKHAYHNINRALEISSLSANH